MTACHESHESHERLVPLLLSLALVALVALAGCTVPVAAGLDEVDANRIVVALDHASVDAVKESDPVVEGKFRVVVARDGPVAQDATIGSV